MSILLAILAGPAVILLTALIIAGLLKLAQWILVDKPAKRR